MADSLWDVISPRLESGDAPLTSPDETTLHYLDRLSTLSLYALTNTEPEALTHDSTSLHRSLQALAKRSATSICASDDSLKLLTNHVPVSIQQTTKVQSHIPALESAATRFAEKYSRLSENALLDRRKRLMRLNENVDRLTDMLELPTLLSSVIASATTTSSSSNNAMSISGSSTSGSTSTSTTSYTTALDLQAHVRRLARLYPSSPLVRSISTQSESAMKDLTSQLISSLRSQNLKLASAMRLISLLRRVAPDLDDVHKASSIPQSQAGSMTKPWLLTSSAAITSNAAAAAASTTREGALGSLFLICRLHNLRSTLHALAPLRELADQETDKRIAERAPKPSSNSSSASINPQNRPRDTDRDRDLWAAGQQTERYLKRYIEVFREQSFATVSMYKSIFPSSLATPTPTLVESSSPSVGIGQNINGVDTVIDPETVDPEDTPVALATYIPHITTLLLDTLSTYLPNVRDRGSRDSLLTQVLYCSASLGRLGGEFGMLLALLEEDGYDDGGGGGGGGGGGMVSDGVGNGAANDEEEQEQGEEEEQEPEWIRVMKKHRDQAGRLETLAGSGGTSTARSTVTAS